MGPRNWPRPSAGHKSSPIRGAARHEIDLLTLDGNLEDEMINRSVLKSIDAATRGGWGRSRSHKGFRQLVSVKRQVAALMLGTLLVGVDPAQASPIVVDSPFWYEFSWRAQTETQTQTWGCFPVDPSGSTCTPSDGANSQFAPAPPWTFALLTGGTLLVTDAFSQYDRFEIFDFGVSLGLTSVPNPPGTCGSDPVPCFLDPETSHGVFALLAGNHSITIKELLANTGAGYFRVTSDIAAVPEPATIVLLGAALATLAGHRATRRRQRF